MTKPPHGRPPTLAFIGVLLFVALLGGGGVYAMALVGHKVTPAPTSLVVVIAPDPITPSQTPTAIPTSASAFVRVTLVWTVEPTVPDSNTRPFAAAATQSAGQPTTGPPDNPTIPPTDQPTSTPTATSVPRPYHLPDTYLPKVSARAREIYQYGLTLGNDPRVFSRLGDCHSSYPGFLGAFDSPTQYRLGDYAYLQDVINFYAGSFSHASQTAYSGLHMGSFFSPLWADPTYCKGGENVMECEYRLRHPSVIFINIGTLNKDSPDDQYREYVRPIIEFWISRGVLPVLNTKADNLEGGERFNTIIRQLAAEYDVPLWDFRIAVQALPNDGLMDDQVHLSEGNPYFDEPNQLLSGWALRNLTGLQALDVVWRSLQQP